MSAFNSGKKEIEFVPFFLVLLGKTQKKENYLSLVRQVLADGAVGAKFEPGYYLMVREYSLLLHEPKRHPFKWQAIEAKTLSVYVDA